MPVADQTHSGGDVHASVNEAKRAHFWNSAFPAVRSLFLSALFVIFGSIQSSRAETIPGSVFGAFIFSVAGVAFWVGCIGIGQAYASVREDFSFSSMPENADDGFKAIITDTRIVDDRYVEYRIDVALAGKQWFVWRRYSDFYRVFKQESEFAKTIPDIMLPSKAWFGNQLSVEFILNRKELLNEYLQNVLDKLGSRRVDEAMAEFFGL